MSDTGQRVRHFYTKVAGVTHRNRDGTSRQRIIERCEPHEKLTLDHEKDNPVDPNAVKVYRENGQQIGYLSADLAPRVVGEINKGYRFAVFISDLTGGRKDAPTRGINLLVVIGKPGVTDSEAQEYVDSLLAISPQPSDASSFRNLDDDEEDRPGRHRREASSRGAVHSLGIGSMVLGVVALLFSFIPCVGVFSMPLSALGLLLGILGGVVALFRCGRGIGFPIAGSAINGMALLIALFWLGLANITVWDAPKRQETSETQSSGRGSQTTKKDEAEEQRLRQGVQELDNISGIPDKKERARRLKEWMEKYPDLVENMQWNIREAAAEETAMLEAAEKRAEENRRRQKLAEDEEHARPLYSQAYQLWFGGHNKQAQERCEEIIRKYTDTTSAAKAKEILEKIQAGARAKEAEDAAARKSKEADAAARKLKLAKDLLSDSRKAIGREAVRLEREYIATLHEIIEKYPTTKAAKESKELLYK